MLLTFRPFLLPWSRQFAAFQGSRGAFPRRAYARACRGHDLESGLEDFGTAKLSKQDDREVGTWFYGPWTDEGGLPVSAPGRGDGAWCGWVLIVLAGMSDAG